MRKQTPNNHALAQSVNVLLHRWRRWRRWRLAWRCHPSLPLPLLLCLLRLLLIFLHLPGPRTRLDLRDLQGGLLRNRQAELPGHGRVVLDVLLNVVGPAQKLPTKTESIAS